MPKPKQQTPTPVKPNRSTGSIASRIRLIEDYEDGGIKILLYGRSGTGKTTLWETFPKPILCIVRSGLKQSGETKSIKRPENKGKIFRFDLQTVEEAPQIIDHAREGNFKTIVLDHASGLQDLTMQEILGLEELPAHKTWGLAEQQQWGQSTAQCKEILRALLNLPQNVVIIAQEREFEPTGSSEILTPYVGAALTPSLAGWLHPACDYVCQTLIRPKMVEKTIEIGNKQTVNKVRGRGVEYVLRTEPHDIYMTKFRRPKGRPLPDFIVDPSYDKIMKIITG